MSLLDTVARLMREAQQLQTSLELREQITHPSPRPVSFLFSLRANTIFSFSVKFNIERCF